MSNLSERINNFIVKQQKVYLQHGEKPPKGVSVLRGKRGGIYYIASRKKAPEKTTLKGKLKFSQQLLDRYNNLDEDENPNELRKMSQLLRETAISKLKEAEVSEKAIENVAGALEVYMSGYASSPFPEIGVINFFIKEKGSPKEKQCVQILKKLSRDLVGNKPITLYRGAYHIGDDEVYGEEEGLNKYGNITEKNVGKNVTVPANIFNSWTTNYRNAHDFANIGGTGVVISRVVNPEEILVNTSFIPDKEVEFEWEDQREFLIHHPKKKVEAKIEEIIYNEQYWRSK